MLCMQGLTRVEGKLWCGEVVVGRLGVEGKGMGRARREGGRGRERREDERGEKREIGR